MPAGFDLGGRNSAETLGEVNQLLQRPTASSGPSRIAKSFKTALIKKYDKLEYAWEEMDSNGKQGKGYDTISTKGLDVSRLRR